MKQIQWARLLGKWEEGSVGAVRNSWTMVSKARHLTCDHKEAWQSNEDNTPGRGQHYWGPLIKAIEYISKLRLQTQPYVLKDFGINKKAWAPYWRDFDMYHLAENILSFVMNIRLHEVTKNGCMQVVFMRWLLPWRAALKPCWQEGRMFNSSFSCSSLDLPLPPTGSNLYQTTDPCHAHTFWTFWPSFQSPDHLQRMWTHPCVGMRCRSELLEISQFPGQLCESYKDWNWFQEKRFSSCSSCSFRTKTNPKTHRVGRKSNWSSILLTLDSMLQQLPSSVVMSIPGVRDFAATTWWLHMPRLDGFTRN